MAQYSIDVGERSDVDRWIQDLHDLNNRANTAVTEGAQAVENFKQTAEGDVVDNLATYANGVIEGMIQVVQGMGQIAEAVAKMANMVESTIDDLVQGVGSLIKNMLGR